MDDFQSTDMIQILNKHGINAKYLSCDTKRQPYEFLKNLFIENRITLTNHELLRDELLYLIDAGKKIDHEVATNDYKPDGPACFLGETKIKLWDGRSLSFEELQKEYGTKKEFYVYSQKRINAKCLAMVKGTAKNPRITAKKVEKLIRVSLSNGKTVEGCSQDHRWMLLSGKYCEAKDLRKGMALKSEKEYAVVVDSVEKYASKPVDLWDIEVEEHSNFMLDAGVYVHNSKDVADALAGAAYMAITTPYNQVDLPTTVHNAVRKEETVNFSGLGYGSSLIDSPSGYTAVNEGYELSNE